MSSKEIVEQGLGSIGKVKILKALAEGEKLATIYVLHKKTHLKREDIKRNLRDLIEIGWVMETRLANAMYSINEGNDYVKQLIIFFSRVGYID
jgi:DNA-binding transcriptional ArsR family regulator